MEGHWRRKLAAKNRGDDQERQRDCERGGKSSLAANSGSRIEIVHEALSPELRIQRSKRGNLSIAS